MLRSGLVRAALALLLVAVASTGYAAAEPVPSRLRASELAKSSTGKKSSSAPATSKRGSRREKQRKDAKGKSGKRSPAKNAKRKKGKASKGRAAGSKRATAKRSAKKSRAARRKRTSRLLQVPSPVELELSPAYIYANFSNEEAYSALDRRGVAYERVLEGATGVRAPVRLTGPLHGVHVHSSLPVEQRATSPFEILDARLALVLDEFCAILEKRDIVELVHFTMYRGGSSPPAESDGGATRHAGGLAIDVGLLRKRDGTALDVRRHFPGGVGAKTCVADAKKPITTPGSELVAIVCEAAAARLFHYMLTPHYDADHEDHFHLEIKPAVRWFLVS